MSRAPVQADFSNKPSLRQEATEQRDLAVTLCHQLWMQPQSDPHTLSGPHKIPGATPGLRRCRYCEDIGTASIDFSEYRCRFRIEVDMAVQIYQVTPSFACNAASSAMPFFTTRR